MLGDDPDTTPFNWMFKSNNTIINIDGDLNSLLTGDVTVVALNETSLKLAKEVDLGIFFPAGTKVVGHFKNNLRQIFANNRHSPPYAECLTLLTRMIGQNWFLLYSLVLTSLSVLATTAGSIPIPIISLGPCRFSIY